MHILRKVQDDVTIQSIRKAKNHNGKRELQNELKKEIGKILSEASTVAAPKEKWKETAMNE